MLVGMQHEWQYQHLNIKLQQKINSTFKHQKQYPSSF
jgi:hypothetical protein